MKNRFRELSAEKRMAMLQKSTEEIYNEAYHAGFKTGYEIGEYNERTGACEEPAPKTANQRRAELIQRAREFVEYTSTKEIPSNGFWPEGMKNPHFAPTKKVEFVTNQEKKTIVCLIRELHSSSVYMKGIAKCHPDEVFNADIGKAIALARALDIEVPGEFLRAVQPDGFAVGQRFRSPSIEYEVVKMDDEKAYVNNLGMHALHKDFKYCTVTDDTNAIYGNES